MKRRQFLHAGTAAAVLGLAGCSGSGGDATDTTKTDGGTTTAASTTELHPDLPDGVYVQPFRETMAMQGTAESGDFAAGVMYAVPHVFWNVVGRDLEKTPKGGDVHLMAVVWDPESGVVVPEAGVTVEITTGGDLVSEEVIYPMLSQRMGFHWGGNFSLAGDGDYTVAVTVGGTSIRRTGAYEGRFGDATTIDVPLRFDDAERSKIKTSPLDAHGKRGAVEPMEMGMPTAYAPGEDDLPGTVFGRKRRDDADFVVTRLAGDAAGRFGDGDYLAVSPRTRYNGIVLPSMTVEATVTRDGETLFDDALTRTLDPELYYHYGASVSGGLQSGDEVTLTVPTPPQVARHEGYEKAFRQFGDPMRFTV